MRLVRVRLAGPANSPPDEAPGMPGEFALIDGRLRFRPAFPLLEGEAYVVEFYAGAIPGVGNDQRATATLHYTPPLTGQRVAPQVVSIFPSGDRLPANHLKFYVLFSQPMQQGEIWDYFTLVDETLHEVVPAPLRHTELWSEDGLRLTLWFHPGRQKTGVNLNVEIGPILEQGHRYSLHIARRWRAQNGLPLTAETVRSFTATAAEHGQVDPATWKITPPAPGDRTQLIVELPQPLDWSLLQRELQVETDGGRESAGIATTGHAERTWRFVPNVPWTPGAYRLSIGGVLEDLAGNSVARPFEVDLSRKSEPPVHRTYLPFRVAQIATAGITRP